MLFILKSLFSGILIAAASTLAKKYPGPAGIIVGLPFSTFISLVWMKYEGADTQAFSSFLQSVGWITLGGMGLFFLTPYLLRHGWTFASAFALGLVALALGTWLTAKYAT